MHLPPIHFKPITRPTFQGQWDAQMKTYPARKALGEKLEKLLGQQPLVLEFLSDIQFLVKTEAEVKTLSAKLAKLPGVTPVNKRDTYLYEGFEVTVKRKDPRKC